MQLSSALPWSLLARLGRTTPMRLTSIAPFIGALLLFNENTASLLTFAPYFIEAIGFEDSHRLTTTNLYFLYFGLSALGVGSFIFILRCPADFQQREFSFDVDASRVGTVEAKLKYWETLQVYFDNTTSPDDDYFRGETLNLPFEVKSDFATLIHEMVAHSDDLGTFIGETGEESDADRFHQFHVGPQGQINTDAIAEVLRARRYVEHPVWRAFDEIAADQIKGDVLFTRLRLLDVIRFGSRVAVSALFVAGFTFLLIPSAITFLRLTWSILQ